MQRRILTALGLTTFCLLLFFPGLGDRDLTSSHEARAAQNAQMILDEGHWLVPQLYDRHLELQKPPLYYWLVALIAWLRGGAVDAWAVRLPVALSALATVLFLYYLGVRTGRPRAALLAALILGSCVHFTWLARVGRVDMPLTMTITIALGAFHVSRLDDTTRRPHYAWQFCGYTMLGIGLLLKGPIAIVLPGLVVGFVGLRERILTTPISPLAPRLVSLAWGVPLMLAIAAPWFVWANLQTNNQLWEVFFWYHNVERGLGGSEALAAHPWWFYGPRSFVDLLPWSVIGPAALYAFLRNEEMRNDDYICQGLVWFGAVLVFLSCMSFKRADYLLPAYPGLAIFLGLCVDRWWGGDPEPSRVCASSSEKWFRRGVITVIVCYMVGWLAWNGPFVERPQPNRAMAAEIRRQTDGPVVFFRAESHVLAYHLGRRVTTILEWENLEIWARRSRPVYFVMPESCADEWRDHLPGDALQEVLRSADFTTDSAERPFVVLRNVPRYSAEIR